MEGEWRVEGGWKDGGGRAEGGWREGGGRVNAPIGRFCHVHRRLIHCERVAVYVHKLCLRKQLEKQRDPRSVGRRLQHQPPGVGVGGVGWGSGGGVMPYVRTDPLIVCEEREERRLTYRLPSERACARRIGRIPSSDASLRLARP